MSKEKKRNKKLRQHNLKAENLSCVESHLREYLFPILRGRVFHVTHRAGFNGIRSDGLIRNNKSRVFPYSFPQSARSYANARGYVSLFDLRTTSDDQLETALSNFYFLNPPHTKDNPVFLIISESLHDKLIPWTKPRDEDAWKEMFMPYVEAFYPGDISTSHVAHVVSVKILRARNRQNTLTSLIDKTHQRLYSSEKKIR